MSDRITVVISQGRSNHPRKRAVEEALVAELLGERGIDVTVVPHLVDLTPHSTGILCLSGISGDMIVCAWLYPRAAHWILDQHGIHGQVGKTRIPALGQDEADLESTTTDGGRVGRAQEESGHALTADLEQSPADNENGARVRVLDRRELPSRSIYCVDLRTHEATKPYADEIQRIVLEISAEAAERVRSVNSTPHKLAHNTIDVDSQQITPEITEQPGSRQPGEDLSLDQAEPLPRPSGSDTEDISAIGLETQSKRQGITKTDEPAPRRWYPVIDYSRCTNCLECIDFCLFGVYGIDAAETIFVEQPDSCRTGCPACSRICPENAIIFPQHKTPSIAGSPEIEGPTKIDLSALFGEPAPKTQAAEGALDAAVSERDQYLIQAGREAVGKEVGAPKHQPDAQQPGATKDDLDALIDQLDEMDL